MNGIENLKHSPMNTRLTTTSKCFATAGL
ncbi:hypothetical protein CBM2600_B30225 [Cupriavidus taiwanensis]|nr:hypothetical protein CBM2600_B30225 [Cupriavidus taiwanensis]